MKNPYVVSLSGRIYSSQEAIRNGVDGWPCPDLSTARRLSLILRVNPGVSEKEILNVLRSNHEGVQ